MNSYKLRILKYLVGILAIGCFGSASLFAASLKAESRKPNFIIILTDDQGWNALSTKMDPAIPGSGSTYYQTPNLDKLANEGMRFSRAYASGATCSPTRHSIQFGRSPASLQIWGADNINSYDAKDNESFANLLKQYQPEYATAHFGKWHIRHAPNALGFEVNDGANGNIRRSNDPENDPKFTFSLTKKAIQFMENQKRQDKPFLLQVSYYADHLFLKLKRKLLKNIPITVRMRKRHTKTIRYGQP